MKNKLLLLLALLLLAVQSFAQTTVTLVIKRPEVAFVHASINTGDSLKINVGAAFGFTSDTTLTIGAQDTIIVLDDGVVRFKWLISDIPGDNEIWKFDAATDVVSFEPDAGGGSGAFSDAGDPVVLNTPTKDVHIGNDIATLVGKVEIGGDADQPVLILEGNGTQTDDIFIVRNDAGVEVFTISKTGVVTLATLRDFTNDILADGLHVEVRNESGGAITVGQVVFISGYSVGQDLPLVDLADASGASTMPAAGLVEDASIANNANGRILLFGRLPGVNTSSFTASDVLYVSETAGNKTAIAPTGTALIQKIGVVLRSHATLGVIEILRSGLNNLPNIASANFWLGNASGVATPVTMSGGATMDNTGALTVANDHITSARINDDEIVNADINSAAAILYSKLSFANNIVAGDIAAGAVTNVEAADMAAFTLKMRNNSGSGDPQDVKISALTDRAAFGSGDKLIIEESTGETRKVDFDDLPGAGGGLSNIVEDTTPQLGGDLDANTFDIQFDDATGIRDDSDNEHLIFQKTASAVNHFEMTNAAAGGEPLLAAVGGDTDVDLTLDGKGSGTVKTLSSNLDITGTIVASGAVSGSNLSGTNTGDGNATGFMELPIHEAKLTGIFVVQTIGGGDASTQGAAIDAANGAWRLLFDATTDEAAIWHFRMPASYSSGLIAKIQYSMTSATSADVEYEVAVYAITPGDSQDSDVWGGTDVNVGTQTVPGTVGHIQEVSITLTNDDGVAAGDWVVIYLSTDANDGTNDDATGDREVRAVQLEWTE